MTRIVIPEGKTWNYHVNYGVPVDIGAKGDYIGIVVAEDASGYFSMNGEVYVFGANKPK